MLPPGLPLGELSPLASGQNEKEMQERQPLWAGVLAPLWLTVLGLPYTSSLSFRPLTLSTEASRPAAQLPLVCLLSDLKMILFSYCSHSHAMSPGHLCVVTSIRQGPTLEVKVGGLKGRSPRVPQGGPTSVPFKNLGLWVKKRSQRRPKTSLGIPGKRKGWQSTWPGELVQEPWQGRGLPRRRSHRRSHTADSGTAAWRAGEGAARAALSWAQSWPWAWPGRALGLQREPWAHPADHEMASLPRCLVIFLVCRTVPLLPL